MSRKRLPARRAAETFTFSHCYPGAGPREFTVAVGFYKDGRPGEAFIHAVDGKDKLVTVDAHDAAIVLSIAMQHGASIEEIGRAMLRGEDGEPHGFLGSLCDALGRMLNGRIEATPQAVSAQPAECISGHP